MTEPSSDRATPLLLASTSIYRRALLARLGLPFRWRAPEVDEEALKRSWGPVDNPDALTERLAEAKVASLISLEPDATIIGGDQAVAFEGSILGKPGTFERAVDQLEEMSGRTHELITSLVVWRSGSFHRHVNRTRLQMRCLTRDELAHVVLADLPFDCAGGYKLESRGITLFDRIETDDHTAIEGLPLIALTTILRQLGHAVP
jgi:septum formation protein